MCMLEDIVTAWGKISTSQKTKTKNNGSEKKFKCKFCSLVQWSSPSVYELIRKVFMIVLI